MAVEVCIDLVAESGERKAFFRCSVADLLWLGYLTAPQPARSLEGIERVVGRVFSVDQSQFRASVVNTATGEEWPVHLPVGIDGECECCGGES